MRAAPFKRGFVKGGFGGCVSMVAIEHGDLIEQRRGGVDVLRILVRNLAVHEQSGAVMIRSSTASHGRQGWLLFRLGQPVMAFHGDDGGQTGLEALLSIEQDALEVENELLLFELTMNALRTVMADHPSSILHLEHHEEKGDSDSWWSSVRLPSSSWRRAARLEDIEALALSTEHRQRAPSQGVGAGPVIEPGRIYLLDSPDPHPMIQLGVELAERGMPLLGLFGLPHAETESTRRLPLPQSHALLSPHGSYDVLADRAAISAVVNAFQWGNERSVIVLDGLDRLGNAFGDGGMLDVFRSICDGVRFNDHVALVTTDLAMFETSVQHSLLAEVSLLRSSVVEAWNDDPDALWDQPLLLAPDEEEEQWLDAQIRHQGAKVGGPPVPETVVLEGGSYEPDEEERAQATQALADVVEAWPAEGPGVPQGASPLAQPIEVGSTAWRPANEQAPIEGRFVSESPRAVDDALIEIHEQKAPRPAPKSRSAVEPAPPKLRTAQRLPKRKPAPALPSIKQGLTPSRSSAVAGSAPPLPDWPEKTKPVKAYRKENMDVFSEKQERALERHANIKRPMGTNAIKDNVSSSPNLEDLSLPTSKVSKTVRLPSNESAEPLSNSLRPVESETKPSRETSSKEQVSLNMDEVYRRWSTFDEPDGMDATALYDEYGEALERYKGGDE